MVNIKQFYNILQTNWVFSFKFLHNKCEWRSRLSHKRSSMIISYQRILTTLYLLNLMWNVLEEMYDFFCVNNMYKSRDILQT